MAFKPKPLRLQPQGSLLTPLLGRSPAKFASSKSLAAYARPGIRVSSSQTQLLVPPQAASAGISPSPAKPASVVPNLQNRRRSLPEMTPTQSTLPKIRSRAASDADLAMPLRRNLKEATVPLSAIKKCYRLSHVGSVMGRPKANNQDAHFYVISITPGAEMSIMGVCDGHGESGHYVSGLVSKTLPGIIKETYGHFIGKVVDLWPTVLVESYKQVVSDLGRQSFDSVYSGSTSVTVVFAGGSLICANVGDSRAVLGRRTGASFTAVALSRDQKPDVEEEKQRILDFGGRVEAINIDGEDIGPLRVWLQSQDAPGLAMTRAMGDTLARRCGVISTPEVIITPLSPEDAFVILASDGIWEFISSQEAVDLAGSYWKEGRLEECCQALVAEATLRWRREEECIDDITVLIAELNTLH